MSLGAGKVERFLASRPVFTRQQFRDAVGSGQPTPIVDRLLAYHAHAGRVLHAAPGVYAAVPLHLDAESFVPDSVLVASMIRDDGVLAYHSALLLHGLAYSEEGAIQVLSCGKPWVAKSTVGPVRFITQPAALRAAGLERAGLDTMDRRGLDVMVTGVERTVVDCLERPDLAGGAEEVGHMLSSVEFVDAAAVAETTFARGNRTLNGLVGWWLERRREDFLVDDELIDRFRQGAPTTVRPVMGVEPGQGERLGDWNLIVPSELLGQTFEDVPPGMMP